MLNWIFSNRTFFDIEPVYLYSTELLEIELFDIELCVKNCTYAKVNCLK